jgi:hypothetical protein
LPVPYFHLVFTLPHALNGLIGAAPRRLYENLFAAASATLTEFAGSPRHLGGRPAFSLVLHTWQQDLGRHVHAHALVAGGALSKVFRGKFVAGLDDLRRQEHLPDFIDTLAWQVLKQDLYAHDWVVYAKQPLGGPQAVLEYLGRYTHRVAISNERIVGIANDQVVFRVRADAEGKKHTLRLPGTAFIDRFLLHVLPSGFKRIRHYGLLSPARKKVGLAAARSALAVPPPEPAIIESVAAFLCRVARLESMCCPHCGGLFRITATLLPLRGATARGPP